MNLYDYDLDEVKAGRIVDNNWVSGPAALREEGAGHRARRGRNLLRRRYT